MNPMRAPLKFPRSFLITTCLLLIFITACSSGDDSPENNPVVDESASVEERQPISGGPILLRADLGLKKVLETGGGSIRLAQNPADGALYFLNPGRGVFQFDPDGATDMELVVAVSELGDNIFPAGMTFGPDGALYIVTNSAPGVPNTQATIYKGVDSGGWQWHILAQTEPYPASGTNFDHLFNGIAVSPDGQWVFVNSGSRTDHGEVQDNNLNFPGLRETGLTTKIFRLPTDAVDLQLVNDETVLNEQGLIFANGTRNAYDLAFAPNGELFGVDNGPDADYPDELNWLREGHHYGFPWRFGDFDNPQQFADYDPNEDVYLSTDFVAVQTGTYANDPDYPTAPTEFTSPILNNGPAGTQYRGPDGNPVNGEPLSGFTPHRSPLGLVFPTDSSLPADILGGGEAIGALLLSWGSAGGTLSDTGEDLLHLTLTLQDDNYVATVNQIARGFRRPIDAVLVNNRLYVLEWDGDGVIWELTFE